MRLYLLGISLLALTFAFSACGSPEQADYQVPAETSAHDDFFANLQALCGETFTGQSTFPENEDHALVGTQLVTHVSECNDQFVRIELLREGGDYWHGAWVVERRDEGLHLFHDHLGEVRTMEELEASGDSHGYGGFASDAGSAVQQFFHADDVTAEMIPEATTNVWMMELDLDNDRFIYYLERHEAPRFRAELFHHTEEEA
ncbi:hypothetical protein CYPRO_2565 [Cyclonatronum proteinivorum]|uniref:HmuY protein n=1 Tax=Cyclonatronum proteinivorum TaxID=1457365 RepID=A0A345UMV5_9BACT|nr:hypothetical protein [Cyclonatronum proteinivorum]AXJ01807.1 hypothetical protein CYPRO_2565 [Cyclonatronum proteinivorum]